MTDAPMPKETNARDVLRPYGGASKAVAGYRSFRKAIRSNPDIKALYGIWIGMRKRCLHVTHKNYATYGGRGITVCPEWAESFARFYA